jgi:lipopolysaccharide export system protein LptC
MTETAAHNARQMRLWKRRSQRVALTRKILPAAIAAIVLIMAGFIAYRTLAPGQLLSAKPGTPMENPRFKGRDRDDQAFLIGAVQALRDDTDQRRIVLNGPFVTLGPARLSAKTGIYRPDLSTLTLQGDVVFDDGATKLTTNQAVFDAKKGEITSQRVGPDAGVAVQGATGNVRADGFRVTRKPQQIELTGNVRGLLTPHRQ